MLGASSSKKVPLGPGGAFSAPSSAPSIWRRPHSSGATIHSLPSKQGGSPRYGCGVVGRRLRSIVTPIYQKTGFEQSELLLDWSQIAGPIYGRETLPLRVSGVSPQRCLFIGASPAVAAEMMYEIPRLIERIHQYFGKRVVDLIRFEKNFRPRPDIGAPVKAVHSLSAAEKMEIQRAVAYPPLAQALQRLAECL